MSLFPKYKFIDETLDDNGEDIQSNPIKDTIPTQPKHKKCSCALYVNNTNDPITCGYKSIHCPDTKPINFD